MNPKKSVKGSTKTSRFWSKKECDEMVAIVDNAKNVTEGQEIAAVRFNVSKAAIQCKYSRYTRGMSNTRLKLSTTKHAVPSSLKGKKRGPNKKKRIVLTTKTRPAYDPSAIVTRKKPTVITSERVMTFDMKDIIMDFANMKIIVKY